MSLEKYTTEELKKELERREDLRSRPRPLKEIDWSPLIKYAEAGLDGLESEGYPGKDFDHYMFETALECIYGPDIWDWWNPLF